MVVAGVARRSNGMQRRHRSTPKRQVGWGCRWAGSAAIVRVRSGKVRHAGGLARVQNPEDSDVFQAFGDHRSGRGDRIRTCDLYVPNVALYQTELHPEGSRLF